MPTLDRTTPAEAVASFTRQAFAAFEHAAQVLGEHRLTLCIAGMNVCLRFAGRSTLEQYERALQANLTHGNEPATLEVCVFDSASSGVSLPSPPEPLHTGLPRGALASFGHTPNRAAFDIGSGLLQLFDPLEGRALVWLRDPAQASAHHHAAPFLQTLSWWLEDHGAVLTHGAAVGVNGNGVLLAGRGGSGKSTTALNCLAAGFEYVSDDYCAVSNPQSETWLAHHLYASGKIAPDNLHRVDESLRAQLQDVGLEKRVAFLPATSAIVSELRLRAVIVPHISSGAVNLEPMSALKAAQALALSTVFQTLGDDATRISQLTQLCRELPCLRLHLGNDPLAVPNTLRAWLESL